ncbi:hypothetical protein H8959_007055 [Pygathrix nigripes]
MHRRCRGPTFPSTPARRSWGCHPRPPDWGRRCDGWLPRGHGPGLYCGGGRGEARPCGPCPGGPVRVWGVWQVIPVVVPASAPPAHAHRRAALQVSRLPQGLQGLLGPALPPARPHRRAALPVPRLPQGLQALLPAADPPQRAHRPAGLHLRPVRPGLQVVVPLPVPPKTAHRRAPLPVPGLPQGLQELVQPAAPPPRAHWRAALHLWRLRQELHAEHQPAAAPACAHGRAALPLPALPQDLHPLLQPAAAPAHPRRRPCPRPGCCPRGPAPPAPGAQRWWRQGLRVRRLPAAAPPAPQPARAPRPAAPARGARALFGGSGDHGGAGVPLRWLRAGIQQRGAAPGAPAVPRAGGGAPAPGRTRRGAQGRPATVRSAAAPSSCRRPRPWLCLSALRQVLPDGGRALPPPAQPRDCRRASVPLRQLRRLLPSAGQPPGSSAVPRGRGGGRAPASAG